MSTVRVSIRIPAVLRKQLESEGRTVSEIVRDSAHRACEEGGPPGNLLRRGVATRNHWLCQAGAQLADAALVHLAGRERIDTVFTLDKRDFSLYKTASGRSLRVVPRRSVMR